jgi:hypothetical protein
MPPQAALKLVIAGPKASGKTLIANFLAAGGAVDLPLTSDTYNPTSGVRILEFDTREGSVELWDASGDHSYESCWKAIMNSADGVILVYNPDAPSQDQQLADWFDFFVRKNGLRDEQCLAWAHRSGKTPNAERFRPPPLFSKVTAAMTTPQSGPDILSMFYEFVKTCGNYSPSRRTGK